MFEKRCAKYPHYYLITKIRSVSLVGSCRIRASSDQVGDSQNFLCEPAHAQDVGGGRAVAEGPENVAKVN